MWPNPQETVDLVTFIEKNLNGKLHFLYSGTGFKSHINLNKHRYNNAIAVMVSEVKINASNIFTLFKLISVTYRKVSCL